MKIHQTCRVQIWLILVTVGPTPIVLLKVDLNLKTDSTTECVSCFLNLFLSLLIHIYDKDYANK